MSLIVNSIYNQFEDVLNVCAENQFINGNDLIADEP